MGSRLSVWSGGLKNHGQTACRFSDLEFRFGCEEATRNVHARLAAKFTILPVAALNTDTFRTMVSLRPPLQGQGSGVCDRGKHSQMLPLAGSRFLLRRRYPTCEHCEKGDASAQTSESKSSPPRGGFWKTQPQKSSKLKGFRPCNVLTLRRKHSQIARIMN